MLLQEDALQQERDIGGEKTCEALRRRGFCVGCGRVGMMLHLESLQPHGQAAMVRIPSREGFWKRILRAEYADDGFRVFKECG